MTSSQPLTGPTIAVSAGLVVSILFSACLASGQTSDHALEDVHGEASYYADKFAGRTTASGEVFDPEAMTAAHPHLPFGTTVRVTRMGGEEGRAVTVRINDRGPFAEDRIIDLSQAAAQRIGMVDEGIVEVQLEVLELPAETEETSVPEGSGTRSDGSW